MKKTNFYEKWQRCQRLGEMLRTTTIILTYLLLRMGGISAQDYSALYNFGNYLTDAPGNFIIKGDTAIGFLADFKLDSVVNNQQYVSSITTLFKYDTKNGRVLHSQQLANTATKYGSQTAQIQRTIRKALLDNGSQYILLSNYTINGRGVKLQVVDYSFNLINETIIPSGDTHKYFPDGIILYGDHYYVFGYRNRTGGFFDGFVLKLDKSFNLVYNYIYHYGNNNRGITELFDLQVNNRGNLVFYSEYGIIGPGGDYGVRITEIDTLGHLVEDYKLEDERTINRPYFKVDRNGRYIYVSNNYGGEGEIYCIDPTTKERLWAYDFPWEDEQGNVLSQLFCVNDMHQCSNGDFLVSGFVLNGKNKIAMAAFLVRLSEDGRQIFHKRYLLDGGEEIPDDTYLPYNWTGIHYAQDLPNGQIFCLGYALRFDISKPSPSWDHFNLWVLSVDSMGCLRRSCGDLVGGSEVIKIDQQRLLGSPNWGIGTRWIYERVKLFPPIRTFEVYEIVDTTIFRGEKVWVLLTPTRETFLKQSDGKVWIYRDEIQDFQLTYDFNLRTETEFTWGVICPDELEEGNIHTSVMKIDTITPYTLPNGAPSFIQHVSYTETTPWNQFGEFGRQAIHEIGFNYGGLFLNTGFLICDNFIEYTTVLRCFENDTLSLQFVDYPCDANLSTSTTDVIYSDLKVYPNPTLGEIQISGMEKDGPYELYSAEGKMVQSGQTTDMRIRIQENGIFILRVKQGVHWHLTKVVKVE